MKREKLKTYMDHFLPREIIGPVIIVFSLEGVISGLFDLYVPQEFATMAWGMIFLASVYIVAKWGTTGEAEEELEEKLEDI
ncbi:MAG: hypothetical protein ACI8Z7_000440 [Candidatus Nanohaloarchaea archaeon]|jgi:hypothetical protein